MSLFGLSRLGGGSKQRQGVDTEVAAVAEAEGQRVGQDDAGAAPHQLPRVDADSGTIDAFHAGLVPVQAVLDAPPPHSSSYSYSAASSSCRCR